MRIIKLKHLVQNKVRAGIFKRCSSEKKCIQSVEKVFKAVAEIFKQHDSFSRPIEDIAPTKYTVYRKKDDVCSGSFETEQEARTLVEKAKKQKKAALYVSYL